MSGRSPQMTIRKKRTVKTSDSRLSSGDAFGGKRELAGHLNAETCVLGALSMRSAGISTVGTSRRLAARTCRFRRSPLVPRPRRRMEDDGAHLIVVVTPGRAFAGRSRSHCDPLREGHRAEKQPAMRRVEDARINRVEDRWLMTTPGSAPSAIRPRFTPGERPGLGVRGYRSRPPEQRHADLRGQDWRPLLGPEPTARRSLFCLPSGQRMAARPIHQSCTFAGRAVLEAIGEARHPSPCCDCRYGADGRGSPPIMAEIDETQDWLSLWHGVEPKEIVGVYRTY